MATLLHRDRQTSLAERLGRGKSNRIRRRWIGAGATALVAAMVVLGGKSAAPRMLRAAVLHVAPAKPRFTPPPFHADCHANPASLQSELARIGRNFDGVVGIAVAKAGCNWVAGVRLDQYFPQQSVSKLWVSLTVLDAVDAGQLRLTDPLTIRPADLTLFNQPLRAEVLEKGAVTKPVEALMNNALRLSDNTANDRLLWTVGGPDRVRAMLADKAIGGIRFGPGERLLQSGTAGLHWQPDYSIGRNFEQARDRLPMAEREAALTRYIANPVDGAQPAGMARALARLAAGQLLSPASTGVMMGILAKTHSGPQRLKSGAPSGWKVWHKTGTGQELRGLATGYNDVGLMQAPDGAIYSVVVLIGQTRRPIPQRMAMMHEVGAALGHFHAAESK